MSSQASEPRTVVRIGSFPFEEALENALKEARAEVGALDELATMIGDDRAFEDSPAHAEAEALALALDDLKAEAPLELGDAPDASNAALSFVLGLLIAVFIPFPVGVALVLFWWGATRGG